MREDITAVDLGEGWATWARLGRDGRGRIRLLGAGGVPIPAQSGEAGLVKTLRRAWRRDRMTTRAVCAGFRSRSVSMKHFRFPAMTGDELASALSLEAAELLNLDRNEVACDWSLSSSGGNGGPPRTEGILVAAPRRAVEERLRLLRTAGLFPVRMDIPGLAVARLIGESPDGPAAEETRAVLNLAGAQADLVVFSRTTVFPRVIHADKGSWEDQPAELAAHVVDAVRYAQYSLGLGQVHRLDVTGLTSDGPTLVSQLASLASLQTALWNPLERLGLHLHASWRFAAPLLAMPTALAASLGLAFPPQSS